MKNDRSLILATQPHKRANISLAKKRLHDRVALQLYGLPKPVPELTFHPKRKWRFDYAWPEEKVALEIHGATYKNGRHTRGLGFARDREKMNEAQLLGWIVIEATVDNLGLIREWIEKALERG